MGTVSLPKKQPARPQKPTIIAEEAGNILQHLLGELPPGAAERLDTGALKEQLSRAIDRQYQQLSARMAAMAAQEDPVIGTRQTSAGVAQLLRSLGGSDTFTASESAKPAGKGKGNDNDLEAYANGVLRTKTGAAAFVCTDAATAGAVSIVKCRFRDNALKPKTVTDVKLAVNLTDAELISPASYDYAVTHYLITDLIAKYVIERIDRGIDDERIPALLADIDSATFDLSGIRGNIARSASLENVRAGGFTLALNALVAILDRAKLDYQCIENNKNGREVIIREYDDSDPANLPDERYALRLRYYNEEQLIEDRKAYDAQINSFEQEVQHLWDLIAVSYHDSKPLFKVNDFEDLAKKNKGRIRDLLKRTNAAPAQEIITEPIAVRFARMHERIKNMYDFLYPVERRVMEDRLAWLEQENARFDFMVNPHHLRPGLLIDVDIIAIKRRKTTLNIIATVLSEFLRVVYGCFQSKEEN